MTPLQSRLSKKTLMFQPYLNLIWGVFSTYALWRTAFSWGGNTLLVGTDGVFHHYPFLKDSLGPNGVLSFHLGQGGGAALHPAVGLIPLERLLIALGFSLQSSINVTLIAFQGLSVYFTLAFIRCWRRLYWSDYLLSSLLIAFSPSLMTRFSAGHVNFILSYLFIPVVLFVFSALLRKSRIHTLDFTLMTFGMAQILSYVGYQTLLYGALLTLPFIIWALRTAIRKRQSKVSLISLLAWTTITTLSFCWMELKTIVEFVLSGELARSPKDAHAVFQYLQPTWTTWAASLFQHKSSIPNEIPQPLHHEIAFPALTLILSAVILLAKRGLRQKWLLLSLLPAALLFLFSFNIPGVSDFFITVVPGLGSFRVITRFMIPFLTLLTCLVILFYRSKERTSPRELLFLLAGIIGGSSGSSIDPRVSIGLEFLTLGLLTISIQKRNVRHIAIGLLAGTTLFGAIERRTSFITLQIDPSLQSKIENGSQSVLERSEYLTPGVPTNVGMFTGQYSLSFYLNPQKSFTDLLGAFTGVDETYRMTADFSSPNAPSFFKALFNSTQEIRREGEKIVSRTARESYPVRIPLRVAQFTPEQVALNTRDRTWGMDYLLSVLDSKEAPPSIPAHCSGLKPRVEHARIDEILVHLDGPTEGCYAVIPVNYSRLIEASATVESGSTRPLKTIRSHQTLLGIELTPGTKTLSVRPKSLLGRQQIIWQWLIGVFCIGVWWIYSRKQSNQKLGCQ